MSYCVHHIREMIATMHCADSNLSPKISEAGILLADYSFCYRRLCEWGQWIKQHSLCCYWTDCIGWSQCVEAMGNGCLTEEHIQELVRILNKILTEHFNRHAARQGSFCMSACFCFLSMVAFYGMIEIVRLIGNC